MYQMPHFTETQQEAIVELMRSHPFIVLIGADGNRGFATQIPVMVEEHDGKLTLRGHIMRQTDHHRAFEKNTEVLVLFTGPQCYVSSGWYSEPGQASTWNYMTVQARGTIRFLNDEGTIEVLRDLTRIYETQQKNPQFLEDLSTDYVSANVKAIVGFEMDIHSLYPIFKLSQNQDDASYKSIVQHLAASNDNNARQIAEEMKKRRPPLFS